MENHSSSAAGNLKRRLEQDSFEDQPCSKAQCTAYHADVTTKILQQLSIMNSPLASFASVKKAVHFLLVCAKYEELIDLVISCGAAPTLVRHLQVEDDSDCATKQYQFEVASECAMVITLTAIKPEHQKVYVDAGVLPYLVDLLRRHKIFTISETTIGLQNRVSLAIANLARENNVIKTLVRMEGGIPPLVELLEFIDKKVRRAAAQALRTLSFKNDANKNQIVECNALPTLVLMLQSLESKQHREAVGVLGNLVHSSPNIKKEVLQAGALQPVICLLSSGCPESQREAALLLGQFASTDSDCKVHIAQRGALPPLINMLKSQDAESREMSSFALGRLAQDTHNQAGIAQCGGIEPLFKLLDSNIVQIQHNAAFTLYGLADNEDNVADIIKAGALKKLKSGRFQSEQTRECVAKTIKKLEEKIQGRIWKHLTYLMCFAEEGVQRRVAIALAHLCSARDCKTIFIDKNGLKLLLDILKSPCKKQPGDVSPGDASAALHSLAAKARSSVAPFDIAPPSPTPQMYLSEMHINNPKLSDIIFLVEGRSFYARRDRLLSSDIFRAMFDGGYREREAKHIVIPNITWDVFAMMMRFIHTGTVEVSVDIAPDLLRAADQYLLDGLKRICEHVISKQISETNVFQLYKMSEDFNATTLKHGCILFLLEKFDNLSSTPWYCHMIRCILPDIAMFFSTLLNSHAADSTIPAV